jgi:ATP-dependent DNA helicase DinG
MDARQVFVKLFTDAAQDTPSRPSVQIIDGYWTLTIKGNREKWAEMVQAACAPPTAEQVISGDTLTVRWVSIADRIFGEGGMMAQNLPGYEARAPQVHMARLCQRAIEMGEPAIVEAGTGVGKSFAYAAVAMAMNKRVVISTSNKALQAQLYQKDIPFLCGLFPGKKVTLAQGKSNYLCKFKCQDRLGNVTIDNYTLAQWYQTTESGNIEELEFNVPGSDVWTIDEDCTGRRCPFYASCFYYKAKAERQDADVIICNHALLILDRLYPQAAILPGCDVVVVDEAHKLADYARSALGHEFTLDRISKALDVAFEMGANTADGQRLLQEFGGDVAALTAGNKDRQIGIKHEDEFASGRRLAIEMHDVADQIWNPEDMPEDESGIKRAKRADKIRNLADIIMGVSLPTAEGHVRWLEPEPNKLVNVPFDVSAFIGRMAGFETVTPAKVDRTVCTRCGRTLTASMVHTLDSLAYGPDCIRHVDLMGDAELMPLAEWLGQTEEPEVGHDPTAIIFTSATIAAPSLTHFMKECGLSHGFQMVAGSPFDYASNAMLYVPNGEAPVPTSAEWPNYAVNDMRRLVMSAKGGAFLLFTSYSNMKYAVSVLRDSFKEAGLKVFVQGELPKGQITKEFRKDGNAVLFATKSFWEGISVEGAALRLVVIDKMPFQAPSPLLKAREAAVSNSFIEINVPEMVIDLKQGSGRLIRRMDDWGVIALLDSRARLKPYGRSMVLPAMPPAKLTASIYEVDEFFADRRRQAVEIFPALRPDFPVVMNQAVYDELAELGF